MKTRMVHTKIWEDRWFYGLNRGAKLLFVYLLTNPNVNMCGLYELSDRRIRYDLKFSGSELQKLKAELRPKAMFHDDWVFIPNARKYNQFTGAKNDEAIKREVAELPVRIKKVLNPYKQTNEE